MEGQLARVYGQYRRQPDDLAKNLYLANLRDRNEVLFYRLLAEHIAEMLHEVASHVPGGPVRKLAPPGTLVALCAMSWLASQSDWCDA
jgi:malate dehydrogenase (oxaloacetate-decarboxylating)